MNNRYLKGNLLEQEQTCYQGFTESRKGQKLFLRHDIKLLFTLMTTRRRSMHDFNGTMDLK